MEDDGVNKLKCIIKSLGIESARLIEEKIDLQYIYLKNLKERLDNDELFLKLIILNALVSYQLSTTGERWWKVSLGGYIGRYTRRVYKISLQLER